MSTRTTIAIFAFVFALGVLLIVLLPFLLGQGPHEPQASLTEGGGVALPDQGVFRSDDGGRTWQQKSWIEGEGDSIASFRLNALVPDPSDPATWYAAADGNGLWVSHSRGDLWAPVIDQAGVLEPRANVLDIAINPANPHEWFVAVFQKNRGRLLSTADDGKTFKETYFTSQERFGVFAVSVERSRGAVLIATGQGGLLETLDRGRTWRVRRWFADGLIRLMVSPVNASLWFVTTPRGSIFRTEDGGGSWADATPALRSYSGATINQHWVMDQTGTLYLGSSHGLLRSGDNALSFEAPPLIVPPDALPILAIAVDPRKSASVVVSALNQLYATRDGGASWAILPSPSQKRITHLFIDAEKSEVIYAVAQP